MERTQSDHAATRRRKSSVLPNIEQPVSCKEILDILVVKHSQETDVSIDAWQIP